MLHPWLLEAGGVIYTTMWDSRGACCVACLWLTHRADRMCKISTKLWMLRRKQETSDLRRFHLIWSKIGSDQMRCLRSDVFPYKWANSGITWPNGYVKWPQDLTKCLRCNHIPYLRNSVCHITEFVGVSTWVSHLSENNFDNPYCGGTIHFVCVV